MSMTGDQAYSILKAHIKDTLAGAGALKGTDGKSAYQLAVDIGYKGTLEEWLVSLKGKDGNGVGFDFTQSTLSDTWTITHSLGNRYPNVTCVDEDGNMIVGDIEFYSEDVTIIRFCQPVRGMAYLNQNGGNAVFPDDVYTQIIDAIGDLSAAGFEGETLAEVFREIKDSVCGTATDKEVDEVLNDAFGQKSEFPEEPSEEENPGNTATNEEVVDILDTVFGDKP